jgi:hypothetical protein
LNQNGVLGEIDEDCSSIYWYEDFCVDSDAETGQVIGVIYPPRFKIGITVLVAMSVSIVCLICVTFVYVVIPALNNLPGKSLTALVCCLLATYLFFILRKTGAFNDVRTIGIMEGHSYLNCGIWFTLLWISIFVNVWYYLPKNARMDRHWELKILISTIVFCVVLSGTMIFDMFFIHNGKTI